MGTSMVTNIDPNNEGDFKPKDFIIYNNKIFFSALSTDGYIRSLWATNGTEAIL